MLLNHIEALQRRVKLALQCGYFGLQVLHVLSESSRLRGDAIADLCGQVEVCSRAFRSAAVHRHLSLSTLVIRVAAQVVVKSVSIGKHVA